MPEDIIKEYMKHINDDKEEYYTLVELAKLLKVHPNTIRNYIKGGIIKAYRVAGLRNVIIRKSELDKLIKNIVLKDETQDVEEE